MVAFARIAEFDVLRPGFGGGTVTIYEAGTTRLAAVWKNPQLTIPAANPQTLLSETYAGVGYGRWAEPLYVGVPYELDIDNRIRTGVEGIPIPNLQGQDASAALVRPEGGSAFRRLDEIAADVVHALHFGELTDSAQANTNVLNAAIGRAAALGGGVVKLPPGNYEHLPLTLPEAVILEGAGVDVTTLRCIVAGPALTLGGNRSNFRDLTLDGVSLVTGSVGVFAVGRSDVALERAKVRRFATGVRFRGATRLRLPDFIVSNCTVGAEILGDSDAGATGQGGPVRTVHWTRGTVELCTTAGVLASFEDQPVVGLVFEGVDWLDNPGDALLLNGVRMTTIRAGRFSGNVTNIRVRDDDDLSRIALNTTRSLRVDQVDFQGGILAFDGECSDVRFVLCDLKDVDFQLSIPDTPILLVDCREDAATTATGATGLLQRISSRDRGQFPGITTDGVGITAWSYALEPGEAVQLRARVIGRQRNGTNRLVHEIKGIAERAPASIQFDNAVGTLEVGSIVSGQTSSASARIIGSTQSGATGALSLRDVVGVFEIGEALATSAGQTARCIAGLDNPAVTIPSGGTANVTPVYSTNSNWGVAINVLTPTVRVQVQGEASQIVEWAVEVDLQRP